MAQAGSGQQDCQIAEMAIVDTFTRLIFGDNSGFSEQEDAIIRALRRVDHNVATDSLPEMGAYLRALGVAEMVLLVAQVQQCLHEGGPVPLAGAGEATLSGHPSC